MDSQVGKYVIFFGCLVVVAGVILYLFPSAFKWFGRLPGDIRIERGNVRFYFPIVTTILLSLLLTLIFNLIKKF